MTGQVSSRGANHTEPTNFVIAPTAHYEWAVIIWRESGPKEAAECKHWLQKAARWEAYELDTRVGLRVTTALDTVNKYTEA